MRRHKRAWSLEVYAETLCITAYDIKDIVNRFPDYGVALPPNSICSGIRGGEWTIGGSGYSWYVDLYRVRDDEGDMLVINGAISKGAITWIWASLKERR